MARLASLSLPPAGTASAWVVSVAGFVAFGSAGLALEGPISAGLLGDGESVLRSAISKWVVRGAVTNGTGGRLATRVVSGFGGAGGTTLATLGAGSDLLAP